MHCLLWQCHVGGAYAERFSLILRGVSLLGVNSVDIPIGDRLLAWQKLAQDWKLDLSSDLVSECLGRVEPKDRSDSQGRHSRTSGRQSQSVETSHGRST